MLVDVSHLNERGFYDVAEYTDKPFLASHSDANIVDNPYAKARNLTDDQIKVLIARNGLIGINLCADFLGNNGQTGADAVLRHLSHFLDLGAEQNLAFGCDYDGCTVHPSLTVWIKFRIWQTFCYSTASRKICLKKYSLKTDIDFSLQIFKTYGKIC